MNKTDIQWQAALTVASLLENKTIPYTIENSSALFVQGIDVPDLESLDFSIQWDLFPKTYELFQPYEPGKIEKQKGIDHFQFTMGGIVISFFCRYNHVVATDPNRVSIEQGGIRIWTKSIDYYKNTLRSDDPRVIAIKQYLSDLQQRNTVLNGEAWNQETYNAWLERFGSPEKAAERIKEDPTGKLSSIYKHLGDLSGKRVINLLGSHGSKAIAMSLLGAQATVVDISQENARYAKDVAQAADVQLRYLVSDVLKLPEEELTANYDLVLMELGILHYFVDLEPLAQVVRKLLQPGGRLVLQDFHPISTKLIASNGKKHKVVGNYFDKVIEVRKVAYSKHLTTGNTDDLQKVYLRKWTLGEVVTAFSQAGLMIRQLEEEPNTKLSDIGIPKTFTLIAEKL